MIEIYRVLVIFLGEPQKKFVWKELSNKKSLKKKSLKNQNLYKIYKISQKISFDKTKKIKNSNKSTKKIKKK